MRGLEKRIAKVEAQMGVDQDELLVDLLDTVKKRRRKGLKPEAVIELEALDQEISGIYGMARERAGLEPPRQSTLEAILDHVNALKRACAEYLTEDEQARLVEARARERTIEAGRMVGSAKFYAGYTE